VLLNQNQEALAATAEANNLMKGEASFDRLWIEKWEALARLRAHATDENLRAVLKFRAKIRQLPDWEAVREIDFYLGLWVRNRSVLPRVYFGTPFRAFRERVRKMSGIDFDAQKHFLWTINYGSEAKQVLELDRLVGELEDQELMGNLLRALASDFYRPISIGDLHQRLYLNEHFDPDSGPKRIYRANERLRKILLKMDCPLSIDATSGFKLIASRPFGLVVPNPDRAIEAKVDSRITRLRAHFNSRAFSVSDVEKLFDQPRRTCQTWLKQMCESGQLEKTGSARWSTYRVKV
jgi:hypothetical protein